jgi:DNA repair exonuclease SbcCD ATPase subunit
MGEHVEMVKRLAGRAEKAEAEVEQMRSDMALLLAEWRSERDGRLRLQAEIDRLRAALEAAKADIEEWIHCFPGDEIESGYASGNVLLQILDALSQGAVKGAVSQTAVADSNELTTG